jgi:hypothetical protein
MIRMEQETIPQPGKSKTRWMLLVALPLAAFFLYLAFRGVDWQEMLATLRGANPTHLAAAFALLSLSCVMRGLRWRVLLSAEKSLPPVMVFWATMVGYLGNAFLPARAGEVVRSVLIGQRGGVSKSFALATALTERLMDAILLVLICAVALLTLGSLPDWMGPTLRLMAAAGAVGRSGHPARAAPGRAEPGGDRETAAAVRAARQTWQRVGFVFAGGFGAAALGPDGVVFAVLVCHLDAGYADRFTNCTRL